MPSDLTRAQIEEMRLAANAGYWGEDVMQDMLALCDLALRFMGANAAALAHCRQHEHPGVSPGYQQACSEIRKLLEGESK